MVYFAVDRLHCDDGWRFFIVDCLVFDLNALSRWHIAIHAGFRDWR